MTALTISVRFQTVRSGRMDGENEDVMIATIDLELLICGVILAFVWVAFWVMS